MTIFLALAIFLYFPCAQSAEDVGVRNLARRCDLSFQAGEARWKEGSYLVALPLLKTARELAQEMKDAKREVKCLMLLGKLYWAIDQLDNSKESYSSAFSGAKGACLRKAAEESGLALDICELYTEAQAELFAGRHEKSEGLYCAALELAIKIDSKQHEAKCLRQLSFVYWAKQDLKNFLSANERSLGIAQELNDLREKTKSLINIGTYHLRMSNYSLALNCYSDALETSKVSKNKGDESLCLKNIGFILSQFGFHERSLDYLLEAHALDLQLGNDTFFPQNLINLGEGLRNRGILLSHREDLYRALDYFAEALDRGKTNEDKKTQLNAANNIGNIYLNLEKYHTAQTHFRKTKQLAEEVNDREARIQVLNNVGICNLKTDHIEDARLYFRQALELGKQIGKDKILWETLFYLGQCHEKKGDVEPALDCYYASIDAIEHIRSNILVDYHKVKFIQNKFSVYEAVINLLLRGSQNIPSSDRADAIFCAVEKAKARAFLETLGREEGSPYGRLNPSLETKEKDISGQISAVIQEMANGELSSQRRIELQKKLRRFEDEYLSLISRTREEAPDLTNPVFPLLFRVGQAQERLLDERTAILEYFLGEKNALLLLITKKEFHVFTLPPRREIETSIEAYLKLLSDPPRAEWQGGMAAKRLSGDLLSPAMKTLPQSVERLILIPDGPLLHFPFETLALLPGASSSGEDYLVSKYAISYAPSCSSLFALKERKKKDRYAKNLLAFGNPLPPSDTTGIEKTKISVANILRETYEGQGFDFSSLPQSDREIKEISSFFSKADRSVCLGREASKDIIKKLPLVDYQIIHFACHGFIDEITPYRSSLLLSSGGHPGEDGFLQVREISNLRLAAELVVLSACETGKGQIEKGEGILGLARSFFYAGAKSVVSALWKIGDRTTARFMRHFYFYLSRGNDKAQALRLAKLAMMNSKYSHPFYWAPFVLNGEAASRLSFR